MKPFSHLVHAHRGKPFVVMGGSPSLPDDVANVPHDAIFISANQHGCLLRKADYMVVADSTEEQKRHTTSDGRKVGLRDHGVPIISMRRTIADYRIFKPPVNNSGVQGAWAAYVMGGEPIILCGMGCYADGVYFHNSKAQSSGRSQPLAHHISKWESLKVHVPGAMIRVVSGPLLQRKVFKPYDPVEPPQGTMPEGDAILERVKGARVLVVREWRLPPFRFKPGEEIEVNYSELSRGLAEKKIKRLS